MRTIKPLSDDSSQRQNIKGRAREDTHPEGQLLPGSKITVVMVFSHEILFWWSYSWGSCLSLTKFTTKLMQTHAENAWLLRNESSSEWLRQGGNCKCLFSSITLVTSFKWCLPINVDIFWRPPTARGVLLNLWFIGVDWPSPSQNKKSTDTCCSLLSRIQIIGHRLHLYRVPCALWHDAHEAPIDIGDAKGPAYQCWHRKIDMSTWSVSISKYILVAPRPMSPNPWSQTYLHLVQGRPLGSWVPIMSTYLHRYCSLSVRILWYSIISYDISSFYHIISYNAI